MSKTTIETGFYEIKQILGTIIIALDTFQRIHKLHQRMARHGFFLTEIIGNIKFSENLTHLKLITLLITKQDQDILIALAICQQLTNTLGNLSYLFLLVDHFPDLQCLLVLIGQLLVYRTKIMTALQKTANASKRRIALFVCRHVVGCHLIGLSQSSQKIH